MAFEPTIDAEIGTPPQTVPLCFDTGSYYPSVTNRSCTGIPSNACGPLNMSYNAAQSSTVNVSKQLAFTPYGAGNQSGVWATDVFRLGGRDANIGFVQNFTLNNRIHYNSGTNAGEYPFTGVLGFAPLVRPGLPWSRRPNDGNVLLNTFGIDMMAVDVPEGLAQAAVPKVGHVQFGGYNLLTNMSCDGLWVPILKQSPLTFVLWSVWLNDVQVDGRSTGICNQAPETCSLLIDTGGATLDAAGGVVGRNHSQFPRTFNCSELSTLPAITFVLSTNQTLTLYPEDYSFEMPDKRCQSALLTEDNMLLNMRSTSISSQSFSVYPPPIQYMLDVGVQFNQRVISVFKYAKSEMCFLQKKRTYM